MIEVQALAKRRGRRTILAGLTFSAPSGAVTGFVGPNGAGKSTTLRCILGLESPSAGGATVDGIPLRRHSTPIRSVGALIDPRAQHPGRSARSHVRVVAAAAGIPVVRVDEVLEFVGLAGAARTRVGTFSLGMRQRLGLATALLGDPSTLVLDEPLNGLDADGVLWMRRVLRDAADRGCTVLVSSHLLHELELIADRIVVIDEGRLLLDSTLDDALGSSRHTIVVRSEDNAGLKRRLRRFGVPVVEHRGSLVIVPGERGPVARDVAIIGAEAGILVTDLRTVAPTLEAIIMGLAANSVAAPIESEAVTRGGGR